MGSFLIHCNNDNLFSSLDVCRYFGIPETTLRSWEKTGKLTSVVIDGLMKYNVREIDVEYRRSKQEFRTMGLDWSYYAYENPDSPVRKEYKTKKDYFKDYPQLEKIFKEAEQHSSSYDTLENYEFGSIKRGRSPLGHHRVEFVPNTII